MPYPWLRALISEENMADTFTVYITADTLLGQLAEEGARAECAALLRASQVSRVVLEGYRAGQSVPETVLETARDFFSNENFETLGGLMPVHAKGFGERAVGVETRLASYCYSQEATVAALEDEIRKLARCFTHVVIDDAFLTSCRCGHCEAERRGRDWGEFRRALLADVGRRWVAAAHEENPETVLAVKFPQYYDRYPRFGYDAAEFPKIFDAVWQGTETRDSTTLAYGYTQPYQGYFNYRWMEACAGEKLTTAWFDDIECDEQLFYEQAVTTFLAAPRDVTIFRYDTRLFGTSTMGRVTDVLPNLLALRQAARNPQGVHIIKPPNTDGTGDLFLADHLGMAGLPVVPALTLEPGMRSVLVTAHAMALQDIAERIQHALVSGRQIILTVAALQRAVSAHPGILEFFGYEPSGMAPMGAEATLFEIGGKRFTSEAPYRLRADLAPTDAAVHASAWIPAVEGPPLEVPLATVKTYASGGRAVVWNIGSFGHDAFDIREPFNVPVESDLFNLPKPVLDFLRNKALSPLGFSIDAPPGVASFVFARHAAFVNYGQAPAEVNVKGLEWNAQSLLSDSGKTICHESALFLAPCSFALLALRRS